MHLRFVRLLVSALFVATIVLAQGDAGDALRDLGNRWAELYNAEDFQGVADLYTEDAILVNFTGATNVGRAAIFESFTQPVPPPMDQTTVVVMTDEIEVFGDTAYGMGTYAHSLPDGSVVLQGSYIVIGKLVDGQWKMHRHLVNMLMPEPAADAP